MTVLILGATGFLGPPLVRALASRGIEVLGASRSGGGDHAVALDRRNVEQVRALVRDRRVAKVIDLLAYVEADTLPLLEALDGEIERWVMASSCDVYRNYEGLHRKASPKPLSRPLVEGSPLRTTRHPYRSGRAPDAGDAWMDDYDKIPLEAALRARPGLSGVVLRLPMMFGPADRQRRFGWIAGPMLAARPRLSVDPAWAAWRTTYGYVDNVADAIAAATLHDEAAGRTFNLGEADAPDHAAWIDRFARSLDWRGEVVQRPAPADSPLAGLDLRYLLVADTSAFRQACSWRDPVPLDEAIARTLTDERSRS